MQARQQKVTIKVIEKQSGDDFEMKTKITKQLLDVRKSLADSTIEIDAIRHNNWLGQAKSIARNHARDGQQSEQSDVTWIVDKEKEKEVQDALELSPSKAKGANDGSGSEKKDEDMNLKDLRLKYPKIKATSIKSFLEQLKAK